MLLSAVRSIVLASAGWLLAASLPVFAQVPGPEVRHGARASTKAWQYLAYPGPLLSQERVVRLTSAPSIEGVYDYLTAKLSRGGPAMRIEVRDRTSNRLRLEVVDAKSLVVQSHDYWEHLTINAHLLRTGEREFDANCPVDAISLSPQFDFNRRQPEERSTPKSLYEEQCTPRDVFELSIIVDGKFAAGGKPSSLEGYTNDMETRGYFQELQGFADYLALDYASSLGWNFVRTIDPDRPATLAEPLGPGFPENGL